MENEDVRFEKDDPNAGAMLRFGAGLVVLIILVVALMWWMFRFLAARETAGQVAQPTMHAVGPEVPPPPRLQRLPSLELQQLRARDRAVLEGYEWRDAEKQIVQIPIEQAIRRLAARGLPTRPGATPRPHEAPSPGGTRP